MYSVIVKKFICYKRICSDHRDFIKCSKELTHRSMTKGYPMTTINKQWQKVLDIQRVNLLRYKEVKPTGRLPIIHTYHPTVERVNETIIKEFNNYSKLTLSRHPFDVAPICVYRQPLNLRNVLVKSKLAHSATSTGNKWCEKRDAIFATSSLQTLRSTFLEQAIFSIQETTTVIPRTLLIS